jgi:hypothetical protein
MPVAGGWIAPWPILPPFKVTSTLTSPMLTGTVSLQAAIWCLHRVGNVIWTKGL